MSLIVFHKMEGTGNDFVVLDNRELGLSMDEIIIATPKLCERKFGIGADGLLVLEPAQIEGVDYTMIYRNADGSDAGMCGNGSRCLAFFAAHHGFSNTQTFNVHEKIYDAIVDKIEHEVSISFPDVLAPKKLLINKKKYLQVYTGTEHIVSFEELERLEDEEDIILEGREIRNHPLLNPPGTNVNFVCEDEPSKIYLQTYERGVENLTLACGTGALASAISTHFLKKENGDFKYEVIVKGGTLSVSFSYDDESNIYSNLVLAGPAYSVFTGSIDV